MAGTWWMVLNLAQDRIVYKSRSCLEAFRVAGRRAGGSVHLERDVHFGVAVTGLARTLMVVPIGPLPRSVHPVRIPIERGAAVAIPVEGRPGAEIVPLPGGGSFTWIPADSPWPTSESPVVAEHGR